MKAYLHPAFKFILFATSFTIIWWPSIGHAQLTHYVPFDVGYAVGDLNGQGGSDLGFGANTWFDSAAAGTGSTVLSGNLTAPAGLQIAGNSVRTSQLDFNLGFYTFDQNNDGSNGVVGDDNLAAGEHWVSFLARADQGAFFAGLSLVKFFGPEILYIGKVSSTPSDVDNDGDVDGADFLKIQRENPSLIPEWQQNYGETNTTVWGIDPQDGMGQRAVPGSDATVDTFLVAKLTIGAGANDDTVELFINPDINSGTPTTPDLTVAFSEDPLNNRSIDEIRLGSQNGAFFADEIRIGRSFDDVAPSLTLMISTAVPEPSSILLLIGSFIASFARLRPIFVPIYRVSHKG